MRFSGCAAEERPLINAHIVGEIDKASAAWGVKVLRYEIKNIKPPEDIRAAMERQMRAERDKRASILESEGTRDALVNTAEGKKQEEIKASEAQQQRQINEAEGRAAAIRAVASATAAGIREVAEAIRQPGGSEAVQLRVAEQYLQEFGNLAKESTTMILPATVSDVASMIALAMNVVGNSHPRPLNQPTATLASR
jgi:regulator of protease activity HflC (stomatin/prohibitin superfamily)